MGMGGCKRQNIAIVGGSVAGTMAGILLSRAGHDVAIYERSQTGLTGRGGGVTTSRTVLEQMKAADILDADFPSAPYAELQLSKITDDTRPFFFIKISERPLPLPLAFYISPPFAFA